jgi:hypothetical protein
MTTRTILSILLSAALATPAELPVRTVILYKHGVGYFERSGKLGQGESARLDFKSGEMNDVLKSLTLEDKGGKVAGLRYDALDPLGQRLSEFPFRIGDAQPVAVILDQLKGARLELKYGAETTAGAIVTGRLARGDEKRPDQEQITLLLDSGELRTFDLGAASGVRLTDARLQQQFRDYLGAVTSARSKDKRSVYIDSTDAREREVTASYMIPTAVWKSSYRLVFGGAPQPTLEGWAIVDNTTGEDWSKVRLSLVSGRPISFITQLYAPRYVSRPAGDLPDETAAGPVVHEGGYAAAQAGGVIGGIVGDAAAKGRRDLAAAAAPAPAPMMAMREMSKRIVDERRQEMASNVAVETSARALGDLFEYRLGQPVTIRKSESAMLPFLQQKIEARKLLIYTQRGGQHPMNAAELTNSTGKTLDGGPITVYDAGAYGGEALMETLKGGDKRLISYAVDLGTRITEAFDSKAEVVREIHARRGLLTAKTAAQETRTYTMRNVDQKAKTLILEHPLRQGYTLLNQKPVEKTSSAYRFEVRLAAGAEEKFAVNEERVWEQSTAVANLTPDLIVSYVSNKSLGERGRKQLEQIAERKNQFTAASQDLQGVEKEIANLTGDEERVRRNIDSLNRVSGQQQQVQNYARDLANLEVKLAQLRDRQAELQRRKAALDSEIGKLALALEF